jgi:glycosyltransferase involved in cell wall biosynthesis
MRIAHVLAGRYHGDTPSGVEKAVYYLSRAQSDAGNEVAVFALSSEVPAPSDRVRVFSTPKTILPFSVSPGLVAGLNAWNPAIVHFHSVYVPVFAKLAGILRRQQIPYVVTPHGGLSPYVLSRRPYLKRAYRLAIELPLLNRAAFVHAVGYREDIVAYGVKAPVVFAPNGIDLSTVPANLDNTLITSCRPDWAASRVLVFLGRLDPFHKGLDLLLRAFHKALASMPHLRLVLVGPDWRGGKQQLQELIAQLGLGNRVLLWGAAYGKQKYELLAGGDVFVLTSRWEGAPLALLEALACRKACLVTRAADRQRWIEASGAGKVVEADVDEIAAAICSLARLTDEELLTLGARGRELVRREFTWQQSAETLMSGYSEFGPNRFASQVMCQATGQRRSTLPRNSSPSGTSSGLCVPDQIDAAVCPGTFVAEAGMDADEDGSEHAPKILA